MFKLKYIACFIIVFTILNTEKVVGKNPFNDKLLQSREALMSKQTLGVRLDVNEELCEYQNNLTESSIIFTDASAKIPAGLLVGNTNHWGHYEQCLSIDETVEGVNIRGKYCMLIVSFSADDNFTIPGGLSRTLPSGLSISGQFAVCVPDACPATMDNFLPGIDVTSQLVYCREANDKPVAPQDIVAIVLFSVLGLLLIMGTSYQLFYKTLYSKDVPKIAKAFSVYHHMEKLTTIPESGNPLSCINGIRTISTLWVIMGHSYASPMYGSISNPQAMIQFIESFGSTFIFGATLAVDTFFFMAAFLLTWSLLKKFNNGVKYLKAAPFVFLNRYLRLTPLLAASILLQVSFFNHVSDGPVWSTVNGLMNICLDSWWFNLLYVQNYMRPGVMDQTTETFGDLFFFNTTRCTVQFLFGIVVAYILFQMKKRNISITNQFYMIAHWILTAALLILPFYGVYSTREGVTQTTTIFFEAWHKPAWVLGVAGVIVACMYGFGGPVQWFLGHRMWTIPARLSYAMYLIHYQIMFSVVGSFVAPFAFSDLGMLNSYINDVTLTVIASFVLYVGVEAPFADLCNMLMAKFIGQKKEDTNKLEDQLPKTEDQLPSSVEIGKEKQDQ